jgi:hypothetical protein
MTKHPRLAFKRERSSSDEAVMYPEGFFLAGTVLMSVRAWSLEV